MSKFDFVSFEVLRIIPKAGFASQSFNGSIGVSAAGVYANVKFGIVAVFIFAGEP